MFPVPEAAASRWMCPTDEQTLIPAQRHRLIREYLEIHQIARSSTLSDLLKASEATIRRDLEFLEMQGIVERTHGGAILSQRLPKEPAYAHSAQGPPGREAGHRAGRGRCSSRTATPCSSTAERLPPRCCATCAFAPTCPMSPDHQQRHGRPRHATPAFEVILLGGTLRPRSNSVAGRFAIDMLKQVYAKKCFVGVDGISLKYNITTPSSAEAEIAAVMIERTRGLAVIVADSSKWGVVSNFEMAKIDQIQVLVTDENLPATMRAHNWRGAPSKWSSPAASSNRKGCSSCGPIRRNRMPLFSKTAKKSTRLFFATDVHGSERTFRKFINAGKFYQANVLVMGGDITGKMMIPIIREGPGKYRATLQGTPEHLEGEAALQALLERIGTLGFYSQVMEADEFKTLHADKSAVDRLFHQLARQTPGGVGRPGRDPPARHGHSLLHHRRQ